MTLTVSNIAWPADEEQDVATELAALGVTAVEIAPTKVFTDPLAVEDCELERYLAFWADHGIAVVAFQSMLFGHPELTIFDDAKTRARTVDHLTGFIELAGRMGATALVFGSPKNRRMPAGMSREQADAIAAEVFAELGDTAGANGTVFCLEPNPVDYDCNFVVNAREGGELVARVDNAGFGLHLDTAGMTLAGDDLYEAITTHPQIRHFHISAPFLGELDETAVDYARSAAALETIGYSGNVSIEMRPGAPGESAQRVRRAVEVARRFYPQFV
jgi:D-psicose/D-tagatose/L-ribulose 3-epimerase